MTPRTRLVVATLIGLVIGGFVVFIVEGVNALIFPLPEGLRLDDMEALGQAVADAGPGVLIGVAIAWFLGPFTGAWLAARLGATDSRMPGGIITVFFLFGAFLNLVAFYHPPWFWVLGISAVLAGGHMGYMVGRPDENRATPRAEPTDV